MNKIAKTLRERMASEAGVSAIAKKYSLSIEETKKRLNDYLDYADKTSEDAWENLNAMVGWIQLGAFDEGVKPENRLNKY